MKNEGAAYRRGVLLGLTMAEIFILIIFLLLLAFASLLAKKQKAYDDVQRKLVLIEKHPGELEQISQIIEADPDITKELVSTIQGMPELLKEIKDSQLKAENETTKEVLRRALDKLKVEKEIAQTAGSPEEQLKTAMEDKAKLASEVENLAGQKEALMKQIESAGHGGDFPPCWPSRVAKTEYIFNTMLTDGGIIVHDNKIPHRAEEQKRLPISNIVFDKPIGQGAFGQQTQQLLNWSNEHKCRFYVQVFDRTGPNEKDLYKNLRTTVEGTFYIFKNEEGNHGNRTESVSKSSDIEEELPSKARPKTWLERQFN